MPRDYVAEIKTGKDLADKKIIPKTSSEHLALISYLRLKTIRDHVLKQINDETLGTWLAAIAPQYQECSDIITNPTDVAKYARVGMAVRTKDRGLEGKICVIERGNIGVAWSKKVKDGTDLGGRCEVGYGLECPPDRLELVIPERKIPTGYDLAPDVVADEVMGHIVRLSQGVKKKLGASYASSGSKAVTLELPKGTVAKLVGYESAKGKINLYFEQGILDVTERTLEFSISELYNNLQVSSLGQIEPLEKEREVKKEALRLFFPGTRLDERMANDVLTIMMMGKDVDFDGPPSSGKSQLASDIMELSRLQPTIFIVQGCQANCNPYSVFDEAFSKKVPPCPECKITYDTAGSFKETGRFTSPTADKVKVVVAQYGEGRAMESAEGTVDLGRMHLTGYKIPKIKSDLRALLETVVKALGKDVQLPPEENGESDFDPKGFHAGKLPRSNSGILLLEEMDKLNPRAQHNLLEALTKNRVLPDELRYSYPANSLVIGTSNDTSGFIPALIDRMGILYIDFPEDPRVNQDITRVSFHGERQNAQEFPLTEDTHKLPAIAVVQRTPMPDSIERAVTVLYMKFRKEYSGPGKNDVLASNRSKFDALYASRAAILVDQLFFAAAPAIVTSEYARGGIQFAMGIRVQQSNRNEARRCKEEINKWVAEKYAAILQQEEDVWWCDAKRAMARARDFYKGREGTSLESNFYREVGRGGTYEQDPTASWTAYQEVREAYEHPQAKGAQRAALEYPFMDHLFKIHPRSFRDITQEQVVQMVSYFLSTRQKSKCWSNEEKAK